MPALLAVVAALLAACAIAMAVVVHRIGLGRVAPGALGLPGAGLRADASVYAGTHRAATPLTWLTAAVSATAAVGSLVAVAQAATDVAAVLAVLSAIVLAVGLTLASWRARTALGDDAVRDGRPEEDSVLGERALPDEPGATDDGAGGRIRP
ncbi:hypothetical protein [Agrococcus carbonis]|uniref:SdpI/YhfL protein family protein n=1 Tax=Agrococcus carbonis TaxID=684552 RepID=A0A1H1S712_9MICO|nr:hypothetical protein [Agrococcus carbonis]SDS43556.1 hypothetical protein SAMN04489719_2314 [Agrococcus carbonis]